MLQSFFTTKVLNIFKCQILNYDVQYFYVSLCFLSVLSLLTHFIIALNVAVNFLINNEVSASMKRMLIKF
jgi:hypothetical protein